MSCFTLCALRRKWDLRLLQRPMNHSLLALQHLPTLSRPPPAARLPLSNTRYVLTHAFTAYSKRGRQGDGSVGCDFIPRSPPNGFSNSCNSFTVTNAYTPWHLVFLTGPTPTHGVRLVKDSRYPSLPSPPFPECTGPVPERSGLGIRCLVRSPSSVLVALRAELWANRICVLTRRAESANQLSDSSVSQLERKLNILVDRKSVV